MLPQEKEETAFETARRPTKGQAYHKNWSTSSDHPLYTGATAGSEHGGVAELLTAQGTTARMYKPIDALRPEIPPRYIARNMYDARVSANCLCSVSVPVYSRPS